MTSAGDYVYKKEVDWSLLTEGLTLRIDNQVVFGRNMGRFLSRGESKQITLYLDGKVYEARITNLNIDQRHNRKKDIMQIRYPKNGDLANALKIAFAQSFKYISDKRQLRIKGDRTQIHLPENCRDFLAIYTTDYEDSYLLETIVSNDIAFLRDSVRHQTERVMETGFNYDVLDEKASIFKDKRIIKIRKLNRSIGANLKLLYEYRCQICGKAIGKDYGSNVVESHHIDYFIESLNNDQNNQLIVCPNHHSIIHDVNPVFDRKKLIYLYPNGLQEGLKINMHL
jgi:hypothetical protein